MRFIPILLAAALLAGCSSVCHECGDQPAGQDYENPQVLEISLPVIPPPDIPSPCQVLRDATNFLCPCERPQAPAAAPLSCPPPAGAAPVCQAVYKPSCQWSEDARAALAPVGSFLQPVNDLACAATMATHSALGVR
ncbi:MAG: hypothetical protein KDB61_09370 [Planctomycetes bacterium]|nr:hypothetical protein [Planctomycetota bacterium]